MPAPVQAVIVSITIDGTPAGIFKTFVDDFNEWYPTEYTWSQNDLDTIKIEPTEGGRCFERGPNGFELDWGRVIVCKPPNLLSFTWQISVKRVPIPNAENAGRVTIQFEKNGGGTKLTLTHDDFENYAEQPSEYRDALASQKGWPYILDCFKTHCR